MAHGDPVTGPAQQADALWRAIVYVAVAQLHLVGNPLLSRPLRASDVKQRVSGHWGTVPGTAWALTHLVLAAGGMAPGQHVVPVIGAGHAGIVQLALAWLSGDLAAVRERFTRDLKGLTRLVKAFPDVDGLGTETSPLLPAGSYLGGFLGGAVAFAQGAALDAPDRVVAPIIGDGECETPTTAGSWLAARELPNGAVLPIWHVNGFRMGSASVVGAMTDDEIRGYAAGHGLTARIVRVSRGDLGEHAACCRLFTTAIDATRRGEPTVIVLRCVKGWGAPARVDGRRLAGTAGMHKTPLTRASDDPEHRQQLQAWLSSYRPSELLDAAGEPIGVLAAALRTLRVGRLGPERTRSGDARPATMSPRFASFSEAVSTVLRAHAREGRLRVFSPDELGSNRLADLAGEPWVTEVLAEEVLLGWLAGWTASGRRGVLVSYEAFAPLMATGLVAHLKQRRLADDSGTWPSLNLLLTSYGWHNVYTHGDPSLATTLLAIGDPAVRIYTPADPTRTAVALDDALRSDGRVNVVIAGKHPTRAHPVHTLPEERAHGLSIWPHLSDDGEPDLTVVCAGDLPPAVTHAALPRLRASGGNRVRVVNLHDLTVLGDPDRWPAGLDDDGLARHLGAHAAVLIVTLGHPAAVWGLLAGRLRRPVEVIGWREPPGPMPQRHLAAFAGLDAAGLCRAAQRLLRQREGVSA